MDLRAFPMDHQSCPLILGSCKLKYKIIRNQQQSFMLVYLLLNDWWMLM